MKLFLLAVAVMMHVSAFAQSDYEVSKDKENGAVVYKGQVTFEDLRKEPSFNWLQRGETAYKPDTAAIRFLKQYLPNYEMVVVFGTWCDDSHILVPKLSKVMQVAGYPMAKLSMYGADRAKQTKNIEHKLYRIERVPTIILYQNHVEIGRIVESVNKSIEEDLAVIIQKQLDAEKK